MIVGDDDDGDEDDSDDDDDGVDDDDGSDVDVDDRGSDMMKVTARVIRQAGANGEEIQSED